MGKITVVIVAFRVHFSAGEKLLNEPILDFKILDVDKDSVSNNKGTLYLCKQSLIDNALKDEALTPGC